MERSRLCLRHSVPRSRGARNPTFKTCFAVACALPPLHCACVECTATCACATTVFFFWCFQRPVCSIVEVGEKAQPIHCRCRVSRYVAGRDRCVGWNGQGGVQSGRLILKTAGTCINMGVSKNGGTPFRWFLPGSQKWRQTHFLVSLLWESPTFCPHLHFACAKNA